MALKILHLDSEMSWRGGQNQVLQLIKASENLELDHHLAAPTGSQALRRIAVPHLELRAKGLALVAMLPAMIRFIDQHSIQILDAQSSRAHGLGLLIKKFRPQLKLIVHRRVDNIPGKGFIDRFKYLNPAVDRYIAISHAIAQVLLDYGVAPQLIRVVRSAVPPLSSSPELRRKAKTQLAQALDFDPQLPLIVNVGYLTEQKGHHTLLEALALVKQRGLQFKALIAGDGNLRQTLQQQAKSLGLNQELCFLGIRDDVPTLLLAADIFAMPSHYEGLGTSLLDAIHAGAAVAATAVGGIPEIIIAGQTGLLSAAKDAEGHALNLIRLLTDHEYALKLVTQARAHALKEFSVSAMAEGNLKVYRELLAT